MIEILLRLWQACSKEEKDYSNFMAKADETDGGGGACDGGTDGGGGGEPKSKPPPLTAAADAATAIDVVAG